MQGCIKRYCYPRESGCNYEGETDYLNCKYWQPDRHFKVLRSRHTLDTCPQQVPWDLMILHERQAIKNHSQTLEELNQRGGLSPVELYAVLRDRPFENVKEDEAIEFLIAYIKT